MKPNDEIRKLHSESQRSNIKPDADRKKSGIPNSRSCSWRSSSRRHRRCNRRSRRNRFRSNQPSMAKRRGATWFMRSTTACCSFGGIFHLRTVVRQCTVEELARSTTPSVKSPVTARGAIPRWKREQRRPRRKMSHLSCKCRRTSF